MPPPPYERRALKRHEWHLAGRLAIGPHEVSVLVLDISGGGARLRFDSAAQTLAAEGDCSLNVEGLGWFPAARRWRAGNEIGLEFLIDSNQKAQLAATLAGRFARP
jgi:hypothetical protein